MNHHITRSYQLKYDLKQLQAFLEVAHTMSFRKAAENLFISQPAISRKISQLEDALNCQLFCRGHNTVKLTAAGEELRDKLPDLFNNLFEITDSLRRLSKHRKLKLGYTCAAISSFLPALLHETTDVLSDYELDFSEGNTTELIHDVLNKNIDGAFIMSRPKQDGLITINIRSEPLGLMIPENHRFKTHDEISVDELKNETLIIFPREQNPSLYDHIFDFCQSAGVYPKSVKEADSCNAIFGFATAGIGVAFIAESMSNLCMKGTLYKPIVKPGPEVMFSFIINKLTQGGWQEAFENAIYDGFCDMDCLSCYQFTRCLSLTA